MEERVNACEPVPASPGELGSTSNSPWKTVGTLDRCQRGKGRESPAGLVLRSQSEASPHPCPQASVLQGFWCPHRLGAQF